ncbi:MAG: hypothetical protein WC607_00235 [Candidatus Micrarchaeia archaeon]
MAKTVLSLGFVLLLLVLVSSDLRFEIGRALAELDLLVLIALLLLAMHFNK